MKNNTGAWLLLLQLATLGQGRPGLLGRQDQSQETKLPDPTEVPADENDRLKQWWYYNTPQQPAGGKPRPMWQYKENKDWYGETTITSAGPTATEEAKAPVGLKAALNEKSGDIDIALSPGMTSKIEAAFKGAPPCTNNAAETAACGLGAALASLSKDKEVSGALQQSPGILAETIDAAAIAGEGELSLLAPEAIKALGLTAVTPELMVVLGGVVGVSLISQMWHVFSNGGNKAVEPIIGVPSKNVAKVALDAFVDAISSSGGGDEEEDDKSKTCVDSKDLSQWPICSHSDCSGQGEGGKKCSADGDKKGCRCLEDHIIYAEPRNLAALEADTSATFDATKISSPECNKDGKAYFGPGVFKGMASLFCNFHTQKEETTDISAGDLWINNAVEPKVSFSRKSKDDECVMDCMGMANRVLKDCSDGSDVFQSGKVSDACGELSYKFEVEKPKEEPKPEAPPEKEKPNCPQQESSFPARVFNSDNNKMFADFCKNWKKENNGEMIVDAEGHKKEIGEAPPKRRRRGVPPPPNGDTAKPQDLPEWRGRLIYEKFDNDAQCSMSCEEAYDSLSSGCRTSQTGSLGFQYRQGSINAGCGRFLYHLYKFDVDWKGAGLCNTGPTDEDYCDQSTGKLEDSKSYSTDGDEGTCRANSAGYGCGSFLAASKDHKCEAFGYEMKHYRQVLKATGAKVCGSVHYDDGCRITFNRVTGCKN